MLDIFKNIMFFSCVIISVIGCSGVIERNYCRNNGHGSSIVMVSYERPFDVISRIEINVKFNDEMPSVNGAVINPGTLKQGDLVDVIKTENGYFIKIIKGDMPITIKYNSATYTLPCKIDDIPNLNSYIIRDTNVDF